MPAPDSVRRNSDETVETDASSLPITSLDSKNSISAMEAFALPVLERHGECPTSLDEGGPSSLAGKGAGSAGSAAAAAAAAVDDSGSTPPGDGDTVKVEKPFEDDDCREMPELTLYTGSP